MQQENNASLLFLGDLCLKAPFEEKISNSRFETILNENDFRIVNFEAPIFTEKAEPIKKAGPNLFQDKTVDSLLGKSFFNVFALANNHIFDFGEKALKTTIDQLKNHGQVLGAGFDFNSVYEPQILVKGDKKIALFNAGESQFGTFKEPTDECGYAWIGSNKLKQSIVRCKENTDIDFIVLYPHAGLEMEHLPLPEWRETYQSFIDLGVDLIIGHHPHVVQPFEEYKGKRIYYSLGNFLFNSDNPHPDWTKSLAVKVSLDFNDSGVVSVGFKHYFLNLNITESSFEIQEENQQFERLCDTLNNEKEYLSSINQACLDHWNRYYNSYCIFSDGEIRYKNEFYKLNYYLRVFFDKLNRKYLSLKQDEVMIYHNHSIETHAYSIARALKFKNKIK